MKSFINVLEEKMKPPFKYFLLPQGCFRRDSYTSAMTLKEAKRKAEEFVIEFKSPIQIMKVFYNDNEGRLGYMGKRILILDKELNWEKDITDDFCLHVAFFYENYWVRQWNPDLYDKLRKDWDNKLLERRNKEKQNERIKC